MINNLLHVISSIANIHSFVGTVVVKLIAVLRIFFNVLRIFTVLITINLIILFRLPSSLPLPVAIIIIVIVFLLVYFLLFNFNIGFFNLYFNNLHIISDVSEENILNVPRNCEAFIIREVVGRDESSLGGVHQVSEPVVLRSGLCLELSAQKCNESGHQMLLYIILLQCFPFMPFPPLLSFLSFTLLVLLLICIFGA